MLEDLNSIWAQVLRTLEPELSRPSFDAWLRSSVPVSLTKDTIVVEVPHDFARDWLETRYSPLIHTTLEALVGKALAIKFVARRPEDPGQPRPVYHVHTPPEQSQTVVKPAPVGDDMPGTALNPRYTFTSFVVGNNNRFAHAAALAVSDAPGKAYNPLFIYGGVGLGKTHLMQAIGHHVVSINTACRVVYVSCEQFTNDLINSIRYEKTTEFRDRYRNVDVLLIDDIQFLAGKERTQEEFFHTFNSLYEAGKQIVISSDRTPKEIATLENRLRSRFEWGLITDIQPPDLETRIAILKKKASMDNLSIPTDVLLYIANQIQSNIRELEGALIRISAYAALTNREVSHSMAEEILKDMLPSAKHNKVSIELIQRTVADYFNVDMLDLKAKSRVRTVALPRQVAMYLARDLTDLSLPKIGEDFGGRDHSTVLHACDKIQADLKTNPRLIAAVK